MSNKRNPQLIVPFSEYFANIWDIWKDYKWASHEFKYRSIFSEQAALEQLVTLSGGEEEKAIKIIKQSMRREWQGLFPLHETTTENGKSKKQSTPETGGNSAFDSAKNEFIERNRKRGEQGDSSNLKAV